MIQRSRANRPMISLRLSYWSWLVRLTQGLGFHSVSSSYRLVVKSPVGRCASLYSMLVEMLMPGLGRNEIRPP